MYTDFYLQFLDLCFYFSPEIDHGLIDYLIGIDYLIVRERSVFGFIFAGPLQMFFLFF